MSTGLFRKKLLYDGWVYRLWLLRERLDNLKEENILSALVPYWLNEP